MALAVVMHLARRGHCRGHVDRHRHHRLGQMARQGFGVVHAVLQAHHQRVGFQQRGQLARHRVGVWRFHAEQNQVSAANRRQIGAGGQRHRVDLSVHVQAQPTFGDSLHMRCATDQRHAVAGTGQHRAVEAADGTGTDNRGRAKRLRHGSGESAETGAAPDSGRCELAQAYRLAERRALCSRRSGETSLTCSWPHLLKGRRLLKTRGGSRCSGTHRRSVYLGLKLMSYIKLMI